MFIGRLCILSAKTIERIKHDDYGSSVTLYFRKKSDYQKYTKFSLWYRYNAPVLYNLVKRLDKLLKKFEKPKLIEAKEIIKAEDHCRIGKCEFIIPEDWQEVHINEILKKNK